MKSTLSSPVADYAMFGDSGIQVEFWGLTLAPFQFSKVFKNLESSNSKFSLSRESPQPFT